MKPFNLRFLDCRAGGERERDCNRQFIRSELTTEQLLQCPLTWAMEEKETSSQGLEDLRKIIFG